MENICCTEKLDLTNTTVNTLIVNCCCKCNGGDKPEPPTPEPPAKEYKTMTVNVDLSNSDPATCCSYADDAVGMTAGSAAWDEFFGHYPVLFKDGAEVGKLNPNDFTKFVDGTAADITSGAMGDVMIAFPRRGLKIETVGDIMTVSMTDDPDSANFEYLAHVRGGKRREVFYLGAYAGHVDSVKLRSLKGRVPTGNQRIATFRDQAQANGLGYEQSGFYQLTFRQAMYLLKYANLNSQAVIGMGYVSGTSPISTGGTETKGMDWGEDTDRQHVKLFGIEDAIGNMHEWIEGIVTDGVYNILTATNDFNDNGVGYINQDQGVSVDTYGYINRVQGATKVGFSAKEVNGTENTYYCDHAGLYASCVTHGCGSYVNGEQTGVFNIAALYSASSTFPNTGARLMYL